MAADSPFFIVGHPRSGTTLLATLFNRHPRVAVPPETHYFNRVYDRALFFRLRRMLQTKDILDLLFRNVRFHDLELLREEVEECIEDDENKWRAVLRALLKAYGLRRGKEIVGEKTPQHLFYVEDILRWYPDAKIMCMVRDPRDAVDSLVRAPWTHGNAIRHAAQWRYMTKRMLNLASRYPESVRIIRMEDLVDHPHDVLAELCRFIEIDYMEAMLRGGGQGVVPSWERSWKSDAERPIDRSKIYKWMTSGDDRLHRRVAHICENAMSQLGYVQRPLFVAVVRERIQHIIDGLFHAQILTAIYHRLGTIKRRYILPKTGKKRYGTGMES